MEGTTTKQALHVIVPDFQDIRGEDSIQQQFKLMLNCIDDPTNEHLREQFNKFFKKTRTPANKQLQDQYNQVLLNTPSEDFVSLNAKNLAFMREEAKNRMIASSINPECYQVVKGDHQKSQHKPLTDPDTGSKMYSLLTEKLERIVYYGEVKKTLFPQVAPTESARHCLLQDHIKKMDELGLSEKQKRTALSYWTEIHMPNRHSQIKNLEYRGSNVMFQAILSNLSESEEYKTIHTKLKNISRDSTGPSYKDAHADMHCYYTQLLRLEDLDPMKFDDILKRAESLAFKNSLDLVSPVCMDILRKKTQKHQQYWHTEPSNSDVMEFVTLLEEEHPECKLKTKVTLKPSSVYISKAYLYQTDNESFIPAMNTETSEVFEYIDYYSDETDTWSEENESDFDEEIEEEDEKEEGEEEYFEDEITQFNINTEDEEDQSKQWDSDDEEEVQVYYTQREPRFNRRPDQPRRGGRYNNRGGRNNRRRRYESPRREYRGRNRLRVFRETSGNRGRRSPGRRHYYVSNYTNPKDKRPYDYASRDKSDQMRHKYGRTGGYNKPRQNYDSNRDRSGSANSYGRDRTGHVNSYGRANQTMKGKEAHEYPVYCKVCTFHHTERKCPFYEFSQQLCFQCRGNHPTKSCRIQELREKFKRGNTKPFRSYRGYKSGRSPQ